MGFLNKLKDKAQVLRTEIIAIYLSLKDKRTPLVAKIIIILTISYAFSPIDLIPDFIPILGYVDDLIILPFMITISIKLIPSEVLNDCRIKATGNLQINKTMGLYAATIIILLWIAVIAMVVLKLG